MSINSLDLVYLDFQKLGLTISQNRNDLGKSVTLKLLNNLYELASILASAEDANGSLDEVISGFLVLSLVVNENLQIDVDVFRYLTDIASQSDVIRDCILKYPTENLKELEQSYEIINGSISDFIDLQNKIRLSN